MTKSIILLVFPLKENWRLREKGDVIAEIHAQEKGVKEALTLLKEAIIIGNDKNNYFN